MKQDQLVYNRLVEVACSGKVVPICEVAGMLDLSIDCPDGRADISRILNTISCQKNAAGRPLLSVVAVKAEIGYPDLGFFLLARALGVNPGYDDRNFFTYELQRVHDFWKEVIPVPGESCILLYPLNVDKEK